ncbi:hypothetical protein T484DRAFT_1942635, partial [Baffinella frigidus]
MRNEPAPLGGTLGGPPLGGLGLKGVTFESALARRASSSSSNTSHTRPSESLALARRAEARLQRGSPSGLNASRSPSGLNASAHLDADAERATPPRRASSSSHGAAERVAPRREAGAASSWNGSKGVANGSNGPASPRHQEGKQNVDGKKPGWSPSLRAPAGTSPDAHKSTLRKVNSPPVAGGNGSKGAANGSTAVSTNGSNAPPAPPRSPITPVAKSRAARAWWGRAAGFSEERCC